jgi:hypothetical protein
MPPEPDFNLFCTSTLKQPGWLMSQIWQAPYQLEHAMLDS